jgi:hypothetical protein
MTRHNYYPMYGYGFFPFGSFLFGLFFLMLVFGLFRRILFGPRWMRWGYGPRGYYKHHGHPRWGSDPCSEKDPDQPPDDKENAE